MPSLGAIGAAGPRLSVEIGVDGAEESERKIRGVGDAADSAGSHMGAGLARGAAMATGALLTGGAAAAGYGLKVAAANEQAQISFTTMLGSAEKAGAFLTQLKDFAAKTPFEFPELQTAASSLMAAGFETQKIIPMMTTLGNVTSGVGTGSEGVKRATIALQQMSAAGKITGEDLNQLRDAGIPVFDLLAGATGKSKEEVAQLAAAGKLGKDEMNQLFDALANGGGPALAKFDGMMDKQSQSLTGMISTLKDTVGQGLADMMTPAVAGIKNAMPQVTEAIGGMIKTAGPALTQITSTILSTFSSILPVLAPILSTAGSLFNHLGAIVGPVLKQLAPYIGKFVTAIGEGMHSLGPLVDAFGQLLVAVAPLLPPLGHLAAVLVGKLGASLLPLVQAMVKLATALVGTEKSAGPLVVILNLLSGIISAIPTPVLTAMVVAFLAWSSVIPIISAVGTVLGVLSSVAAAFGVVLGIILSPIGAVVLAIAAIGAIVYVVIRNWSTIVDFFKGIWEKVKGAFSAAVGFLGSIAGTVGRVLLAGMTGGLSEVVLFFVRNWDKIKAGFGEAIGALGRLAGSIGGKIKDAVGDLGHVLWEAGKAVITGLIGGITSKLGALGHALGGVGHFISDHKGPRSYDLQLLVPAGRAIMEGLQAGILGELGALRGTLGQVTSEVAGTGGALGPGAGTSMAGAARSAVAAAGQNITVIVQGSVIAERDLSERVRTSLARRGLANVNVGLA